MGAKLKDYLKALKDPQDWRRAFFAEGACVGACTAADFMGTAYLSRPIGIAAGMAAGYLVAFRDYSKKKNDLLNAAIAMAAGEICIPVATSFQSYFLMRFGVMPGEIDMKRAAAYAVSAGIGYASGVLAIRAKLAYDKAREK